MDGIDRILDTLDQGLQSSTECDYVPDLVCKWCWRCNKEGPTSPIGLCANCDEWLHGDSVIGSPESASLLPHGTLPEEVGEYRPFGEARPIGGDHDWPGWQNFDYERAEAIYERAEARAALADELSAQVYRETLTRLTEIRLWMRLMGDPPLDRPVR